MFEEEGAFNFEREAAEIEPDMVTSLELTDVENGHKCNVALVTLEQKAYQFEWTVQSGLVVKTCDGIPSTEARGYEDLNQFLQSNSPGY